MCKIEYDGYGTMREWKVRIWVVALWRDVKIERGYIREGV